SAPLTISFRHRHAFELGAWDGGVIEISTNNGATWTDIGAGAYNGATNAQTAAPIGASRPAFVNRNLGWPNFVSAALNLGTTYANQPIRIRFRIGADETTGAPGWDIDDIAVGGRPPSPPSSPVRWRKKKCIPQKKKPNGTHRSPRGGGPPPPPHAVATQL